MLFPQKNRLWFFVNLPVPNSTSSAFTSKLSRYMPLSRANSVRFTVCVAQPLLSVYRQQQGWITKYRKWIGKREKVFMLNTHSQSIGPADVPILITDVPVEPPGFSTKHCLDWTRNWFPIGVSAGNSTRYGRVFCYKATPFTRHKSPTCWSFNECLYLYLSNHPHNLRWSSQSLTNTDPETMLKSKIIKPHDVSFLLYNRNMLLKFINKDFFPSFNPWENVSANDMY